MVLYKRKPVQSLPPAEVGDDSEEVWQIPQTGETFTNLEKYNERMEFYKTKQFSCEITGHMNLTFFEALASENQHSQDVEQAFPEPLKEPVLRRVQFSTVSRIDTLVDQLHEGFKNDFYPGEHVTAILASGDRLDALVREKTMFPELRLASGEIQRKGFSRYTVKLINRNDEEAQIDNEHLLRDKKTFTKAMLRSFIKNTVSREPWNGAPWLVKEEFAVKYKIPQNVPPNLQRAHNAAERKAQAQARRRQEQALSVAALTGNQDSSSPPVAAPVDIRPAPKSHKSKTQQAIKFSKIYQIDDSKDVSSAGGSPWASSPGGTPDGSAKTNQKILMKPSPPVAPPKPIKYPIEDLDLPPDEKVYRPKLHTLSSAAAFVHEMPIKDDPQQEENGTLSRRVSRSSAPAPMQQATVPPTSNPIDQEKVAFYLSTWVYLNIFCQVFILDSFTFDDYVQALEFTNEDVDCELFVEIHCTLLKAIVNEQGIVQAHLPEMEENEEEDEDEDEEEDAKEEEEVKLSDETVEVKDDQDIKDDGSPDDSPSRKQKKYRADELFGEGDSWVQRLKARDFKSGGWQIIIAGLLYQLSFDSRYSKDAEEILAHLVPPTEKPTRETVTARYRTLDVNLRVMVIHLLSRLTHETKKIREYMEECSDDMTSLRKEKIEVQRARKVLLEQLKGLDDERKILLPENTPKSPSPEPETRQPSTDADGDTKMNGGLGDEEDEEDEDDEDVVRARALRRGGERANERKRKREEEKMQAAVAAKLPKTSKQFQQVLKSIEKIKAQIKKEEEKIATFDEDLRQADCSRFKMMGIDRYYNKYWWFERNGMPFGGIPDSSTAEAGYANAMIWVQGPEESERQGFLVEEAGTAAAKDRDGDVQMNGHGGKGKLSVLERRAREENGTTLESPTQYGYLETVEEFNQLMSWLDVRGVREKKLKATFEVYRKHIEQGMQNREKYLAEAVAAASDKEVNGARTTRGKTYFDPSVWRCLNWRNDLAIDEIGHLHYEQPQKKKNSKKNGARKSDGVPLNRQGKPVSRQGERYSF